MRTIHRWFRSGDYSLLGHIDYPEKTCGPRGLVIVPPFGWEDVCSYRPLRFLARDLADHGIPTLRFDLPGTGDSSGDAQDAALFDAWVRAVGDAADELRIATGVEEVAVLGVRMGAMLALLAAIRGANIYDLVLWGPSADGRSVVRELRAFSKLTRAEYATGAPTPPPPVTGLEIGGFLLAPETQRALENLDLSSLPSMQGRRVLVLMREDLPADEKLVSALQASGCTVEVRHGSGYSAMMAIPEEALPPADAALAMVDFLTRDAEDPQAKTLRAKTRLADGPASRSITTVKTSCGEALETIFAVERQGASIFGILAEPVIETPPGDWCIFFLNPGAVRHTGPNRMWVEAARRWAARGIMSLRLDLQGIGESDGEHSLDIPRLYQDRLVEQIEIAMDSMRSRSGARRFVAIGLCAGAHWAFHAALRNRDIRSAILLNPRLFFWDPEVDRRRILRRTARLLTDGTDWARLVHGYVSLDSFKRVSRTMIERFRHVRSGGGRRVQIPPHAMAQAWEVLKRNQSRVTLIFTEGEPLLREMEEEGHLPAPDESRIQCIRVANCGHTFRPLWAQQMAHELIDKELEAAIGETRPEPLPQTLSQSTLCAKP